MFVYVLFLYFSGRVFFYVAQYIVFGATQAEDLICWLIPIRAYIYVKDTTVTSCNLVTSINL